MGETEEPLEATVLLDRLGRSCQQLGLAVGEVALALEAGQLLPNDPIIRTLTRSLLRQVVGLIEASGSRVDPTVTGEEYRWRLSRRDQVPQNDSEAEDHPIYFPQGWSEDKTLPNIQIISVGDDEIDISRITPSRRGALVVMAANPGRWFTRNEMYDLLAKNKSRQVPLSELLKTIEKAKVNPARPEAAIVPYFIIRGLPYAHDRAFQLCHPDDHPGPEPAGPSFVEVDGAKFDVAALPLSGRSIVCAMTPGQKYTALELSQFVPGNQSLAAKRRAVSRLCLTMTDPKHDAVSGLLHIERLPGKRELNYWLSVDSEHPASWFTETMYDVIHERDVITIGNGHIIDITDIRPKFKNVVGEIFKRLGTWLDSDDIAIMFAGMPDKTRQKYVEELLNAIEIEDSPEAIFRPFLQRDQRVPGIIRFTVPESIIAQIDTPTSPAADEEIDPTEGALQPKAEVDNPAPDGSAQSQERLTTNWGLHVVEEIDATTNRVEFLDVLFDDQSLDVSDLANRIVRIFLTRDNLIPVPDLIGILEIEDGEINANSVYQALREIRQKLAQLNKADYWLSTLTEKRTGPAIQAVGIKRS